MDRYRGKVPLPKSDILVKSVFCRFLTLFDLPTSGVGGLFCTTFLQNCLLRGRQKTGHFWVKKWSKNGHFGAVNVPKFDHHQNSTMRGFWKASLTPSLWRTPLARRRPHGGQQIGYEAFFC